MPADAVFNDQAGLFFPLGQLAEGQGGRGSSSTVPLMTPLQQSSTCGTGFTSPHWIMNGEVQCSAVPPVAPRFPFTTFMCISFIGLSVFHTDLYHFLLIQY